VVRSRCIELPLAPRPGWIALPAASH